MRNSRLGCRDIDKENRTVSDTIRCSRHREEAAGGDRLSRTDTVASATYIEARPVHRIAEGAHRVQAPERRLRTGHISMVAYSAPHFGH